jgi:glutaredoxin 3
MKQIAKIKMIKKNPCPYCDRAITFLNNKGAEFEIVDLTNNLQELQTWKEKTGWSTVPMIFIGEKMIGGYNDLKSLEESGDFDKLVFAP